MGSGKTTVSKSLAHALAARYIPQSDQPKSFLPDLFDDQRRWAFDAQTAFLVYKSVELKECIRTNALCVLDRGLSEDIDIFADHFYKKGHMDERSYSTYRLLAAHLRAELPQPRLTVFCRCSLATIQHRLQERSSGFQSHYPPDHVAELFATYEEWFSRFNEGPVCILDTDRIDCRLPKNASAVAEDVWKLLRATPQKPIQLSLFGTARETPLRLSVLEGDAASVVASEDPSPIGKLSRSRAVYLAAPFSGMDSEIKEVAHGENLELLPTERRHGVIPQGPYRSALISIQKVLTKIGIRTIIPHRDVNQWGVVSLTPTIALHACIEHVEEAAGIIAILGSSCGVHLEYGLARGMGKAGIVIRCEEIASSFLAQGVQEDENVFLVECQTVREIASHLAEPKCLEFMVQKFLWE